MSLLKPDRCEVCRCDIIEAVDVESVSCCKECSFLVKKIGPDAEKIATFWMSANGRRSWDHYFMGTAAMVAAKSKDPSSKVGAVIVKDKTIISTGYNGLPRGCNDTISERYMRPLKYKWITHAEENAILNGHRNGLSMTDSAIYVMPLYPCAKCTGAIIQAGIKRVICKPLVSGKRWEEEFTISQEMMREAQIEYQQI